MVVPLLLLLRRLLDIGTISSNSLETQKEEQKQESGDVAETGSQVDRTGAGRKEERLPPALEVDPALKEKEEEGKEASQEKFEVKEEEKMDGGGDKEVVEPPLPPWDPRGPQPEDTNAPGENVTTTPTTPTLFNDFPTTHNPTPAPNLLRDNFYLAGSRSGPCGGTERSREKEDN